MEWRSILSGVYEVSQSGEIRRVGGGRGARPGEILKQQYKDGYRSVNVSVDGWAKRYYVHRLVAEAFIGPCPAGHIVDHKDGDRAHNHWTNLQYVPPQQNSRLAGELGQLVQGEQHAYAKVTVEQVRRIRALGAKGAKNADLAREFGLSPSTAHAILQRRTWKMLPQEGAIPPKTHAPNAKISEDQVREIRRKFAAGVSQAKLCKEFGLKPAAMHHIVHGITWKQVT